jgi:hypothetical protein
MLLRSPAECYYRYLVIHPDGYDNPTIQKMVGEMGIDWISDGYVNKLRDRAQLPDPFHAWDDSHGPSYTYLCNQKLLYFFFPDPDMETATAILDQPRAREFIETMLLSHAPPEAIAKTVTRNGVPCTRTAVERYAQHFWNVGLLDSTQMKILLQWRFERISSTVSRTAEGELEVDSGLYAAGKKASYQDPRRLAADLPFSPFAALLVQMRMGVMPEKIDVATRMTAVRDMATVRALETLHFATPGDANRALSYVTAAKIMQELLETVQKPDEQLREQLSAIALRTDDRPVPSIHQLSAGRHTVDLQPTAEGNYEPEPLADSSDGE